MKDRDWMYAFNNNDTRHYVIMYAGEYTYKTDKLQKEMVSIPSSDVIDFTKLNIVKGIPSSDFMHGLYEEGCGKEKGCFAFPSGCIKYATCNLLITYKIVSYKSDEHGSINKLYVELKVIIQHNMKF